MKILNCNNIGFGALFGKKEVITRYNKDGSVKIRTFQHVHPFKDEFKTDSERQDWLANFKQSSFYKNQNSSTRGVDKEFSVIIEPELPFVKDVYKKAKKDGVQLLSNPAEFCSVTTKYEGYYPSYAFENGEFECII